MGYPYYNGYQPQFYQPPMPDQLAPVSYTHLTLPTNSLV